MASFADLFERSLPHILEKIFLPLDLGTLANCAEVCQSWRSYLASGGFRRAHLVRLWMDPNLNVEKMSVPVPQAVFQGLAWATDGDVLAHVVRRSRGAAPLAQVC